MARLVQFVSCGSLSLGVRIAVEFAEGEVATGDVATKLAAALDKLGVGGG